MGCFKGDAFFPPVTLSLKTTDKLHTEMPFRDVAEIATLDNERSNIVSYLHNNMPPNNVCLEELDPDPNTLDNCRAKKV